MTPDEIAKALRTLRCADPCNCLSCPCEQFRSYVTDESCDDGTRLAAADLIESLQAQLADYHHMSELVDGKMEENQRLRRINENLTARAEKAEAENRWIPVSERLPEFNERVLIAYEIRGKRCIAIDEATCSNSGVAVWFSVGYACHVTHWWPLPEPPKGE